MQHAKFFMLGIASALLIPSVVQAARPEISTDTAPGVNFGAYHTYSWVSSQPPGGMNPVLYQRVMGDFDSALAGLGYRKADSGGDMALALTVGTQNKTDFDSWGRFGFQTSVYQYTQGQLSLDAFDTKTKQALWHGQATETVNPDKPNEGAIDFCDQQADAEVPADSGSFGRDDTAEEVVGTRQALSATSGLVS